MPSLKMTERSVAALRAVGDERLEIWDQELKGLCLRVSAESRIWFFRHRRPDGTQPRIRLGHYISPENAAGDPFALTVAGARAKARKLRSAVDDGEDPATARRAARAAASAQSIRTVTDMAEAYFKACETGEYRPRKKVKRTATLTGERWLFKKHIEPRLGLVRVEALDRNAVRARLRALVAEGKGVTANRVRALLRQIYAWGISEERVSRNPATEVAAMVEEIPRARVLSDDELKAVWQALSDPTGWRTPTPDGRGVPLSVGRPVRIALQLCLLTMQRRGEIARMRLKDLDLARGVWLIPAEMTKAGRAHTVPLAARSVSLIREAIALRDDPDSPWVFPGRSSKGGPVSPNALSQAFRDVRAALEISDITPHDARRTAATLLASERAGVSPFVIGLLLNHAGERGGAAAVTMSVYVRADFMGEKRRAINAWEGMLMEIVKAGGSD